MEAPGKMKFYHCFNTNLPDQFVEANAQPPDPAG
jgi:hypothetical protein